MSYGGQFSPGQREEAHVSHRQESSGAMAVPGLGTGVQVRPLVGKECPGRIRPSGGAGAGWARPGSLQPPSASPHRALLSGSDPWSATASTLCMRHSTAPQKKSLWKVPTPPSLTLTSVGPQPSCAQWAPLVCLLGARLAADGAAREEGHAAPRSLPAAAGRGRGG